MWCFIDESWHVGKQEQVGVLAGVVGPVADFTELDRVLYRLRKKYYGEKNAKDLRRELKGTNLFSNLSFQRYSDGFSKNISLVRELLEWAVNTSLKVIGITVYGKQMPPLLSPKAKQLSVPFKELCVRILAHLPKERKGMLIFDQRIGAQEDISIAICHYLAGIPEPKHVIPHPFVGVSNVWPGLQLADIVAHILGRYAVGDRRIDPWYHLVARLKAEGHTHRGDHVYGFARLQWTGGEQYVFRKDR